MHADDNRAGSTDRAEKRPLAPGQTILVVDDDDSLREYVHTLLRRYRYAVVEAEDGVEAVQLYAQDPRSYFLVIMDVQMPIMSGPETLTSLRMIDPRVRVLFMSDSEMDMTAILRNPSAVGFIRKPFQAPQLLPFLRQSVERPVGAQSPAGSLRVDPTFSPGCRDEHE